VIGFWGFWGFPLLAPPVADLDTFEEIVIIYCRSGRMPTALAALFLVIREETMMGLKRKYSWKGFASEGCERCRREIEVGKKGA